MTSIAQGKRSDTLGKSPRPITPRPARAKANIIRSVSTLLPLQGAGYTAHYTQGAASLALGYELLPLWGVPVSPHAKPRHVAYYFIVLSACEKSVPIRCADGASKPSGRQRSKSKESVKRPIRAHRCNYLPLVSVLRMSFVRF